MGTFFMFGRYSHDSIKSISARRTEKTKALIEKYGGRLVSAYALLGDIDLVLILELPGKEEAMKTSVALSKMLGIGFTTAAKCAARFCAPSVHRGVIRFNPPSS
jgi:uncharacterized protein with GYD domain